MSEEKRKRKGHSEETRRKMSETRKGVPHSEAHKRAISIASFEREARKREQRALMGTERKVVSEETRRKMNMSRKGKPLSEAHREAIRKAALLREARKRGINLALRDSLFEMANDYVNSLNGLNEERMKM